MKVTDYFNAAAGKTPANSMKDNPLIKFLRDRAAKRSGKLVETSSSKKSKGKAAKEPKASKVLKKVISKSIHSILDCLLFSKENTCWFFIRK